MSEVTIAFGFDSPPRERMMFESAEPLTPKHQRIPDPLLNPPGAPKKSKKTRAWSARQQEEDSPTLRAYLTSLPWPTELSKAFDTRRDLTGQFDQVARQGCISSGHKGQAALACSPRLVAEASMPIHESFVLPEYGCRSLNCPSAGQDSISFFRHSSILTPLPQEETNFYASDSDSSLSKTKDNDFIAGEKPAKRARSMSHCFHQFSGTEESHEDAPPQQPNTPCKAPFAVTSMKGRLKCTHLGQPCSIAGAETDSSPES